HVVLHCQVRRGIIRTGTNMAAVRNSMMSGTAVVCNALLQGARLLPNVTIRRCRLPRLTP
ncbi:hypothetical protein ABTN32_20770, partial [Acinetobacter baumannii]